MTADQEQALAEADARLAAMTDAEREALLPCCDGVLYKGSDNGGPGCLCWEPVHDVPQVEPMPAVPTVRASPCSTCACHVASGSLADGSELPPGLDEAYGHLLDRASSGRPFFCHAGQRRRIADRHPRPEIPDRDRGAYHTDGPFVDGVPYRACGEPAHLCPTWAAEARKHGHDVADIARRAAAGEWPVPRGWFDD